MSPAPDLGHLPVMLSEVVELFGPVPPGVLVDGTLGGAGHARALLEAYPGLRLVGIDRDPEAVAASSAVLGGFGERATVLQARFSEAGNALDALGVAGLSGALLDLGVSSWQLDRPERGFGYRHDGPLDMRMDPTSGPSAADLLDTVPEAELARILADYGDERFADRVARAIVAARPLGSTRRLAEVVRDAIPAATRRSGGHPARRSFQALRIAVNDELRPLPGAIDELVERLVPGGRIVVLSYHSGEDRIVKDRLRNAATGGCECPPGLPCVCGARPSLRLLGRRGRRPSAGEISSNPRAESARLRAGERLPTESRPTESLPTESRP
ncbi:MAG: 16S rRNA (cytosine(1402)-N(4))-methyltransferase RsmH [Actinomycetota bacterium]|nr:16S rRNA (cytosine(1402)-N(4))-methyltransferase RsmH [Actinomycetota bacterium]